MASESVKVTECLASDFLAWHRVENPTDDTIATTIAGRVLTRTILSAAIQRAEAAENEVLEMLCERREKPKQLIEAQMAHAGALSRLIDMKADVDRLTRELAAAREDGARFQAFRDLVKEYLHKTTRDDPCVIIEVEGVDAGAFIDAFNALFPARTTEGDAHA